VLCCLCPCLRFSLPESVPCYTTVTSSLAISMCWTMPTHNRHPPSTIRAHQPTRAHPARTPTRQRTAPPRQRTTPTRQREYPEPDDTTVVGRDRPSAHHSGFRMWCADRAVRLLRTPPARHRGVRHHVPVERTDDLLVRTRQPTRRDRGR